MLAFIKHHKLWVSIIAVLLLLSATALISLSKSNVDYISPKRGDMVEAIYGLGKVKTDNFYEVKMAVVNTVKELYVREGDSVKKGDKLVRMEGNTIFRAPFDGTVTMIAYHESQSVFPQQTILRMEDLKHKYIEVSLEQQGALRVKKGQAVKVIFESVRGDVLTGKVDSIFPRNDEFLVHVRVSGLGDNVLPGMTADVSIEVGHKKNVLQVPLSGISNGRVTVLRDEQKVVVPLKIGSVDGNWAEVISGDIRPGDQVIVQRRPQ